MSPMVRNKYPDDWEQIAMARKNAERWKCERCGTPDSKNPKDGHCLTVHHLVSDPMLCEDWNLAVLCQKCHLKMQHVNLFQRFMFEVSDWMQWHLEGFMGWKNDKA